MVPSCLQSRLRQALEDVASREREISRLTQECVELRMSHVRRMGSASPDTIRSTTPPGIEKDSLNSSVHSNYELQVPTESISLLNEKEIQKEEDQKFSTSVRLEILPVLQENLLMSNGATNKLDTQLQNQEEKENLSNNRQLNKHVFSKDMNQRSISVKSVIDDNDCSQLAPPCSLPQPLSLADSGTCDEDLSLISPPSDLALTNPELDSQDLEDGELYREVLEALQSSQHSALSATVSNKEHEKVVGFIALKITPALR